MLVKIVGWKGSGNGQLIVTCRWEINRFVSFSNYSDEQKWTDWLLFERVVSVVTGVIGKVW